MHRKSSLTKCSRRDRHHLPVGHGVGGLAGAERNDVPSGKLAERGQDEAIPPPVKASQAQPLPAASVQPHDRVQMTAQHEAAGRRPRFVAIHKGGGGNRRLPLCDVKPLRGRAGAPVVIAAHEHDLHPRVPVAPRLQSVERCVGHAGRRVKEVAQDDEAIGSRFGQRRRQAVQVRSGAAMGQGNGARPKRSILPEVHVGSKQRPGIGPQKRSVGPGTKRDVGYGQRQAGRRTG